MLHLQLIGGFHAGPGPHLVGDGDDIITELAYHCDTWSTGGNDSSCSQVSYVGQCTALWLHTVGDVDGKSL